MARRLARIAALTTLLVPSLSAALGIGSLTTESALNEPLEARIPLESADLDEIETLSATLASPEAFERAGLERPFMLSRLEFEVVTEDGAEPYVLIRTSEPVREPFLAFLVELNWAGGRLVREYTMLLDPPVHSPEQESAPAVADDGPVPPDSAPESGESATVSAGDRGDPEGVREVETADEIQVQDDDTLWGIAEEARPGDDISVHQMMMALLEANPDAFTNGNVNNLRSGAILRVPERGEAEVLTASEARQQFAAQVEAWQSGRAPESEPEPTEDAEVAEGADEPEDGRLEVVAAGETAGDDATASLTDEDLEATPENVARLQSELAAMREEEATLRSENEDLRQQTDELMERVEALERTLDIQVEGALPGMADEPAEEAIPLAEAQEEMAAAGDEAGAATAEDMPLLFSEDSVLERDLAALDDEAGIEEAEPVDEESAPEEAIAGEAATEEDASASVAVDEPAMAQAPWEDTRLVSLGAGGALLLLLLLLLMIRRRRNAAADASGMVAAAGATGAFAADGEGDAATDERPPEDELGAGESAPRDGVDPLEEIEVYLAYGRYDQAGDLLASAIAREPERTDLRLKQLEVHALTHDRAGFEADAQELYALVEGSDDPTWQQVQDMGREIAPENPLFAGPAVAAGPAAPAPEPEATEAVAEEPAPADEQPPLAEQRTPADADEDDFGDLDFSLDDGDKESAPTAPAATEETGEEATASTEEDDAFSLDFDLDDFQAPADGGESAAEAPAEPHGEAGDDALSLDFEPWERPEETGARATTAEPDREAAGSVEEDEDAPSFNLDDLDLSEDRPDEEEAGLHYEGPGAADEREQDEPLVPSEEAEPEETPGAPAAPAEDSGVAEDQSDDADDDLLDAGDENSTKLDLARAYLDMGDSEGARSLLDEVIAEGSEEQKQEARSLYEEA